MLQLVVLALLPAAVAHQVAVKPVRWEEVRREIEKTICVGVHELPSGENGYSFNAGSRPMCTEAPAETPLARAVDVTLDRASVLLRALRPGDTDFQFDADAPIEQNNAKMRQAYLSSPRFLRPIMAHLHVALADEGLHCEGCPSLEPVARHLVRWEVFLPYLTAHFWPDPVESSGQAPTGQVSYSLHICSGINGISEIESPDEDLVRAGYVVAIASKELQRRVVQHFKEVIQEEDFAQLVADEVRTAYLRRRLPERIAEDPRIRPLVCQTLACNSADLGMDIEGCPSIPDLTPSTCPKSGPALEDS